MRPPLHFVIPSVLLPPLFPILFQSSPSLSNVLFHDSALSLSHQVIRRISLSLPLSLSVFRSPHSLSPFLSSSIAPVLVSTRAASRFLLRSFHFVRSPNQRIYTSRSRFISVSPHDSQTTSPSRSLSGIDIPPTND